MRIMRINFDNSLRDTSQITQMYIRTNRRFMSNDYIRIVFGINRHLTDLPILSIDRYYITKKIRGVVKFMREIQDNPSAHMPICGITFQMILMGSPVWQI